MTKLVETIAKSLVDNPDKVLVTETDDSNGSVLQLQVAGSDMDILIQVNSAMDERKFGITTEETDTLIREISEQCPNVRIKGLMCIAPFEDNPDDARQYFAEVKKIFDKYAAEKNDKYDFQYLSMGMTNDYQVAVEEGSNLIRVGTAIFGYRDYRKEEK